MTVATTNKLIDVTPLAAEKLGEVISEQGEEGSLLRVIVTPGGHGGVQYMLGLEQAPNQDDMVIDIEDLRLLVDAESAPLVEGAQIDYVDGLMRSGFVITNPNLPMGEGGGCACGGGGGGCGCGGGGGGGGCGCGGH